MTTVNKLATRGIAWTIIDYGASQLLRLCVNLILTRLLIPELFGLMALVQSVITGLHMFSDIGIGPSIIQNQRGNNPDFINTAWTLQVIRGFAMWFLTIILAWPVSCFYNDSRLLWLIPIIGLTTIMDGLNSTARFTLNRNIFLGKITIFNLGVQFILSTVMVLLAWNFPSVLSLVAGLLTGSLLKMIGSHFLIPGYKNRFTYNKEVATEILKFGKWIFLSTVMTFFAAQADRLILGKLLSFQMLGVYSIAATFSAIPQQLMIGIGGNVIFPLVSQQLTSERAELRRKIASKRKILLIFPGFLILGLAGFGDFIIVKLYDDRYSQASWMLPLLAIGIWPAVLYNTASPALIALGKPVYSAIANFSKALVLFAGLPIGFSIMDYRGAIICIAASELPVYLIFAYGLWREGLSLILQDIKTTALFFVLLIIILINRNIIDIYQLLHTDRFNWSAIVSGF